MFWKKNKGVGNRQYVAIDNDVCDYDGFDIDVKMAIHNYETYQNDLNKRCQNLIEKWCKEIRESSSKGEKYLTTNQFITGADKNKILLVINDAGCVCDFPPNATLQYFQQYFEDKGFKVVKIEYPTNNICCLKIIWVSSDN